MSELTESKSNLNLYLGIAVAIIAALIAFVWIPIDVESAIFEKVRRRYQIGDAFAPTLAAGLLGLGGLLLVLESFRSPSILRLSKHSLLYVLGLIACFAIFTILLMGTGPLLVSLFAPDGSGYRLLRDTVPWKYSGFVLGGTFLITSLIAFVEHRLRWQSVVIGIGAAALMIVLYDFPFDDLLLPPNGDY